jgi:hypothetical protein
MLVGADLIPGAEWDDWLLAVVGILVAVTTVTALSHKPPLAQVGRFIGWIFRRLIGEPFAKWSTESYKLHAVPLVRAEVEAVIAPIREEQRAVAADLRAHMATESEERHELVKLVTDHVEEDRAAFQEITTWRAGVDDRLGEIRDAQNP